MSNKLKILFSNIKYFALSIISKIINILPHENNVLLFESNSDFCDNPRALFDYMIKEHLNKKYKMVWVVKEKENIYKYNDVYYNVIFIEYSTPKLSKKFFKLLYYQCIADYTFYSHSFIGVPTKKKQIRFFMTHAAIPIKNTINKFWDYRKNTYILSTSEFSAYYRCLTFNGGLEKVKILGFPRNDNLFDNDSNIKSKLNIDKYSKVIIWMPTFKHHKNGQRNDFNTDKDTDISLLTAENMEKIDKKLKEKNMCLIVKFHPCQNMDFVKNVNMDNIKTISNEELLTLDIKLYSLVGQCDALITDFSSIYIDYLLLDRPIGFEIGDKTKYENGIGFSFDKPLDYMPGDKISKIEDMIKFIDNVGNNIDKYKEDRRKLNDIVNKYKDNNSSKRIVEFLKLNLEDVKYE